MSESNNQVFTDVITVDAEPSAVERFLTRLFGRFRTVAEQTVDEIHGEIEELAETIDRRADELMTLAQNKKIEFQDEIAALSRRIAEIDKEGERIIELGKRADGLRNYVRAGRTGTN